MPSPAQEKYLEKVADAFARQALKALGRKATPLERKVISNLGTDIHQTPSSAASRISKGHLAGRHPSLADMQHGKDRTGLAPLLDRYTGDLRRTKAKEDAVVPRLRADVNQRMSFLHENKQLPLRREGGNYFATTDTVGSRVLGKHRMPHEMINDLPAFGVTRGDMHRREGPLATPLSRMDAFARLPKWKQISQSIRTQHGLRNNG